MGYDRVVEEAEKKKCFCMFDNEKTKFDLKLTFKKSKITKEDLRGKWVILRENER